MAIPEFDVDVNVLAAAASVAAAAFSWFQARNAQAAAQEANDLTRMDRAAQADQLHVAAVNKRRFRIVNPMPDPVFDVSVSCVNLPNPRVLVGPLDPNETETLEMKSNARAYTHVMLQWTSLGGDKHDRRVKASEIWRHIKD